MKAPYQDKGRNRYLNGRSSSITTDSKSKDYYTKMMMRAKEIDSST